MEDEESLEDLRVQAEAGDSAALLAFGNRYAQAVLALLPLGHSCRLLVDGDFPSSVTLDWCHLLAESPSPAAITLHWKSMKAKTKIPRGIAVRFAL